MSIIDEINKLKQDPEYQTWKDSFLKYVHDKQQLTQPIQFFLMYDIDDRKYCIKSEVTPTFNMIALQSAWVMAKKDKDQTIKIKECEYK